MRSPEDPCSDIGYWRSGMQPAIKLEKGFLSNFFRLDWIAESGDHVPVHWFSPLFKIPCDFFFESQNVRLKFERFSFKANFASQPSTDFPPQASKKHEF
jgi:hypothetical protein